MQLTVSTDNMAFIEISVSYQHESPVPQLMDRAFMNVCCRSISTHRGIRLKEPATYFVESRTACGKLGIWLGSCTC